MGNFTSLRGSWTSPTTVRTRIYGPYKAIIGEVRDTICRGMQSIGSYEPYEALWAVGGHVVKESKSWILGCAE